MRRYYSTLTIIVPAALALAATVSRADSDPMDQLLHAMPAELSAAIVVPDFSSFDAKVQILRKRFAPADASPGLIADIKEEVPFANWIDFGKPVGIGLSSFDSASEGLMWVCIPGFAAKAKAEEGVTLEDGIWQFPSKTKDEIVFARAIGDYVITSTSKTLLAVSDTDGESLAQALKARMDLFSGNDVLIHVNGVPLRERILGNLAQIGQMAPMIAMMAAQQAGIDSGTMTGIITSVMSIVKSFVEQFDYLDVGIALGDSAGELALSVGFADGPIQTYLSRQKPATAGLLMDIQDQPFFFAVGYHVPGSESPFFDAVHERMINAIPESPAQSGAGAAVSAAKIKESLNLSRDLFRKVEGQNMLVAMSPTGMRVLGDYITADAPGLAELLNRMLESSNSMMQAMNNGVKYEASDPEKIGDVQVQKFMMRIDTTNPAGAQAAALYGPNPCLAFGPTGDRVRFCIGGQELVQQFFAGKVDKPLAAGRYVKDTLAALPKRHNAVILIDPASFMPMMKMMMGGAKAEIIPPGPTVGISLLLAGNPARLHVHVPFRAIERVIQASGADEPM